MKKMIACAVLGLLVLASASEAGCRRGGGRLRLFRGRCDVGSQQGRGTISRCSNSKCYERTTTETTTETIIVDPQETIIIDQEGEKNRK